MKTNLVNRVEAVQVEVVGASMAVEVLGGGDIVHLVPADLHAGQDPAAQPQQIFTKMATLVVMQN